jgi:hypothetical protein
VGAAARRRAHHHGGRDRRRLDADVLAPSSPARATSCRRTPE